MAVKEDATGCFHLWQLDTGWRHSQFRKWGECHPALKVAEEERKAQESRDRIRGVGKYAYVYVSIPCLPGCKCCAA